MMRKALLAAAVALLAVAAAAAADPLKVTLLGTWTPTPRVSNFSAATLVEAGPENCCSTLVGADRCGCSRSRSRSAR